MWTVVGRRPWLVPICVPLCAQKRARPRDNACTPVERKRATQRRKAPPRTTRSWCQLSWAEMYRDGTNAALTERLLPAEPGGETDTGSDRLQTPEEISANRKRNIRSAIIADALWTLADSIWAGRQPVLAAAELVQRSDSLPMSLRRSLSCTSCIRYVPSFAICTALQVPLSQDGCGASRGQTRSSVGRTRSLE